MLVDSDTYCPAQSQYNKWDNDTWINKYVNKQKQKLLQVLIFKLTRFVKSFCFQYWIFLFQFNGAWNDPVVLFN